MAMGNMLPPSVASTSALFSTTPEAFMSLFERIPDFRAAFFCGPSALFVVFQQLGTKI
jgi:hypothetical protein